MPRKRNPRNEMQRQATEGYRVRLVEAGIPESCHVDNALSAALYIYARECRKQGIVDQTLGKLLRLAGDILETTKDKQGNAKWSPDSVRDKVVYRVSHRTPSERQRLLRSLKENQARKRVQEHDHEPF